MTNADVTVHDLVLAGAVVLLLMAAGGIAAALWLRRRWRRMRRLMNVQAHDLTREASRIVWQWISTWEVPNRGWRRTHQARRHLHQAVAGAERTVRVAGTAGAPLGDLEAMTHRLGRVATNVDRRLWLLGRAPAETTDVQAALDEANDIGAAAAQIQRAALAAMGGATSDKAGIVEDIRREAAAVTAGVARMRELAEIAPSSDASGR
jgi:hypothetical protein